VPPAGEKVGVAMEAFTGEPETEELDAPLHPASARQMILRTNVSVLT
jgi:hypothetical protein